MKKLIFAAVIGCIGFVACKKKDTTTPKPTPTPTPVDTNKAASRYVALTSAQWRVSDALFIKFNIAPKPNDTFLDYYNGSMPDCEKDNFITFNTSGNVTVDEGATKCDPSVEQSTTDGSWLLNKDTTEFTIKDSKIISLLSGEIKTKVVLIDKNNFQLSKDTTINLGSPIEGTIILNFKRK